MTKEDIKQICQIYDNFRSERDAATIAYNSDDTFWEHILATYNLSQPSLPSNLDEAANEKVDELIADMKINGDMIYLPTARVLMIALARFGAEWMAGQGYTFETIMQEDDVDELVPTCPDMYNHGYSCSDKVIVQIRRKQ